MTEENTIKSELIIGGLYKHYKGQHYKVLHVARHSEDLTNYVVYQALYGDFGVWIRPLDMFLEKIEVMGQEKLRFQYIPNNS